MNYFEALAAAFLGAAFSSTLIPAFSASAANLAFASGEYGPQPLILAIIPSTMIAIGPTIAIANAANLSINPNTPGTAPMM